MSDDTIRLLTIGRLLRRRRRLLAVLAVVGALIGYGTSALFPPRYTASASVLLPGQWEERELLTQVEIATSSSVVDRAAAALDWRGVSGTELRDRVRAQAADGKHHHHLRYGRDAGARAAALRPDGPAVRHLRGTDRGRGHRRRRGGGGTRALRQKVRETDRRITELAEAADPGRTVESVQARTELEKLRTALQEAMKKLDDAAPAGSRTGLVVMGPAARPTGEAPPTTPQRVGAGALLFFLLGVVWQLAAARMSRRLDSGGEIAAALGSVLLGTVEVPGEQLAHRHAGRGRARIRRLLGLDTRWHGPVPRTSGGEADRRIRCRRVCARLREELPAAPRRVLAVVPEGDVLGRRAAEQLAAETRSDPLLPAVGGVRVPPAGAGPRHRVRCPGRARCRQLDRGGARRGIAGACADAGHRVLGAVVAEPVRARPERPAGRPAQPPEQSVAVGGTARGGPA